MLKIHKDSFNSWLAGRIRAATRGLIQDLETGEYIEVATARSPVFLEHTRRRGAYNKNQQKAVVLQKSLDQAKADLNDPFTFARTKTHLENGLCALEDYSVEFQKAAVEVIDFSGEVVGKTMRDVARNVKRA